MADDVRTVSLPLPPSGRFVRSRSLELRLSPDWTLLADGAGQPLPPQQWAPRIEHAGQRKQLVLRMLATSSADSDGHVLARACQVTELTVLGLTVTVGEPAETPGWLEPRAFGPSVDEIAKSFTAEPAILGSRALPRYLRLARDLRSGDVSWALLRALAGDDDVPSEPQSAEIWLRYLLPVPHSSSLVTLQLCGHGDAGLRHPLAAASWLAAAASM